MKVFANQDRQFISKLARDAANNPKVKIVKPELPKDEPSSTEEATEHAKSYWMMGWAWDEIEVILEELEFSSGTISKAIKKTQEYAKEILKDGPFNIFKDGQKIVLKSGIVGKLEGRYADHLAVRLDDGEQVKVTADNIDLENSEKLTEAFALRSSANKLYKQAQEDILKVDDREVRLPGAPEKRPVVSPEPEEKFETKIRERAPSGWGEITPKMSEVEEITDLATSALNDLDNLMIDYTKVQEENRALLEMSREIKKSMKELEKTQTDLAQNIFAIVATQNQALDDLDVTVFNKYNDKLVGLQRKVESQEFLPTHADELAAVKEFLEMNHPSISAEVKQVLDQWVKQNTQLKEVIKNTFAYYQPEKKKMGQMLPKVTEWVSGLWKSVRDFASSVTNKIIPEVEQGIALIDSLDSSFGAMATKKRVKTAMKRFNK
jgi:preprotein translocase subunit YajC